MPAVLTARMKALCMSKLHARMAVLKWMNGRSLHAGVDLLDHTRPTDGRLFRRHRSWILQYKSYLRLITGQSPVKQDTTNCPPHLHCSNMQADADATYKVMVGFICACTFCIVPSELLHVEILTRY